MTLQYTAYEYDRRMRRHNWQIRALIALVCFLTLCAILGLFWLSVVR